MSIRIVWRGLLVLLLDAFSLLLLSELLNGFVLDGAPAALGVAAAIGLLNALLWAILARIALPLTVLTLGRRGAAPQRHPQLHLRRQPPARRPSRRGAGGDRRHGCDDGAHRGLLLAAGDRRRRRLVPRRGRPPGSTPGQTVDETDIPGVSRSSRSTGWRTTCCSGRWPGEAPRPGRLAASGTHRLRRLGDRLVLADRRLPGRAASRLQRGHAGLPLVGEGPRHGDRHQPPARCRRARAAALRWTRPAARRRRQPRQHPLGDAPHSMLTMSTALHRRRPIGRDYAAYFARPYAVAQHARPRVVDVIRERRAARRRSPMTSGRGSPRPRLRLVRAWATVVQRDLQVASRRRRHPRRPPVDLHDLPRLRRGRPPLRDRTRGRPRRAPRSRPPDRQDRPRLPDAPRPYRLVVLSDHGQSQGETFRDRYGETLEEVVRAACDPESMIAVERARTTRSPTSTPA